MGNLPKVRVNAARPFTYCGVDYGGPLYIKEGGTRSKRKIKSYIAVFVCLVSKAIHIELVTSLTTEAFLAALRRCMGRRGKICEIWSDNATNFVGASNELNELYRFFKNYNNKSELVDATSSEKLVWHFIPPNSPHFGGIWEAGIKSIKTLLRRTLGTTLLTYEEMSTCLIQIEAILNSRPLTPLSSYPNDLSPLTPAHFLVGDSLLSNAEPNLMELKQSHLSRWQHIQRLRQDFWSRWRNEYLHTMQERTK